MGIGNSKLKSQNILDPLIFDNIESLDIDIFPDKILCIKEET